jgi:choline dehydrogenase-like flavoprotein
MILDPGSVDRDLRLRADVCVVGSGAGGSVAAYEFAAAGRSVVVLEEGRYWTSRNFTQLEEEMYLRLYRERGTKPTANHTVLVSQGRALGGSTLVSLCMCFRTPRRILDHWRDRFGLSGLTHEALFPHLERVERRIGARSMTPEELNENNRVLQRGSERLGYRGGLIMHNRTDCLGCGYCALGCAYDRKGDALTTYLDAASKRGARLLPEVHVERVLHDRNRVYGVEGHVRRSRGGRRYAMRIEAPVVVLAAGALESPLLWLRSELPNRHRRVGRNLRLQPCAVVTGVFDDPIRGWEGPPQGYVVDEFLQLETSVEGGFLLFAASAPPVTAASLLPGLGRAHRRLMSEYAHTAGIAFFLHDRSAGEVRRDRQGRTVVEYRLVDADKQDAMRAMGRAAEILFAAGARSVMLPYNDLVELGSREEIPLIEERGILANDPLFVSFQPQGTLAMGDDPRTSVIDPDGRAHAVDGLFVADASVFPTSVAVPPQVSVMAFASRTAERIRAVFG